VEELREDGDAGKKIIETIRLSLHQKYPPMKPVPMFQPGPSSHRESLTTNKHNSIGSRLFQRLHPREQSQVSDIDKYFDSPLEYGSVVDASDPMWLCKWWDRHSDDYPQMAAAARDYLAIPGSGVAVERLFNKGRDVLGIRRHSMKSDTI